MSCVRVGPCMKSPLGWSTGVLVWRSCKMFQKVFFIVWWNSLRGPDLTPGTRPGQKTKCCFLWQNTVYPDLWLFPSLRLLVSPSVASYPKRLLFWVFCHYVFVAPGVQSLGHGLVDGHAGDSGHGLRGRAWHQSGSHDVHCSLEPPEATRPDLWVFSRGTPNANGLVEEKTDRKPWFLPSNIGGSCKLSQQNLWRNANASSNVLCIWHYHMLSPSNGHTREVWRMVTYTHIWSL